MSNVIQFPARGANPIQPLTEVPEMPFNEDQDAGGFQGREPLVIGSHNGFDADGNLEPFAALTGTGPDVYIFEALLETRLVTGYFKEFVALAAKGGQSGLEFRVVGTLRPDRMLIQCSVPAAKGCDFLRRYAQPR